MFALFSALAGYWAMLLLKSPKSDVQHIHWLMLALASFKSLTLFGQAVMYLVIEHQGSPHGWNWVYYTFTALRGLLFFTVVILIGTGWSFMSSHVLLDERTKQVLMLVIPLQVCLTSKQAGVFAQPLLTSPRDNVFSMSHTSEAPLRRWAGCGVQIGVEQQATCSSNTGQQMFRVARCGWDAAMRATPDTRLLLSLLPLFQVLANLAIIVTSEESPAFNAWLTWKDLLHLVDIICCCAVLFPIMWSIRKLREDSEYDGKAARSLVKLQQIREFYTIVVAFIWVTRIGVYLMETFVDWRYKWTVSAVNELAVLTFYVVVGTKFRPGASNPYLRAPSQDGAAV